MERRKFEEEEKSLGLSGGKVGGADTAGKRGQSQGGKEEKREDRERVQGKADRKGGVPPGDLGMMRDLRVSWEEQAEEPRAFCSFLNWTVLPPVITVECGLVTGLSLGTGRMGWGAASPEEPGELAWSPEQRLALPNFPRCCDGVQGVLFFTLGTSLCRVGKRQGVGDSTPPKSGAGPIEALSPTLSFRATELLVFGQREINCLGVTL